MSGARVTSLSPRLHRKLSPRTLAVLVPNDDETQYLGLVSVTDSQRRMGILDDAPDSGPFKKGDLIQYRCSSDYEFPLVVAGYGPHDQRDTKP